ncbi:MAG: hypothetical protein EOP04_17060 [Proteobacteria bacterium]|nr:MAG: hypothetical protein EOP04_17060 [Pseudomonadota bacterium]
MPIGATGSVAEKLWNEVLLAPDRFYGEISTQLMPLVKSLNSDKPSAKHLVGTVVDIMRLLNK